MQTQPNPPAGAPSVPRWGVLKIFGLGILMILPVALIGGGIAHLTPAGAVTATRNFLIAFAGSSLPEEIFRFAVLYYFAMRPPSLARPSDGLVYGVAVSLGFSCAENVLYAVAMGGGMGLLKLAVATPIHLALGLTMGGLLALEREGRGLWLALGIPLLLHGVYDFVLLGALGAGGNGLSAASRLAAPVLVYCIVIGFAVSTFRRVRATKAIEAGASSF